MFIVRPILKHFSILLLFIPFLYGELYVGHWVLQMWELQTASTARTTLAHVTMYGRSGDNWVVKYHFQVLGDSTVYSAQSINYRDTFKAITDQAYEAAIRHDGQIEVRYLPHDPWLNEPVGRAGTPLAEGLLSWSCMVPFNLIGLVELVIIIRNYLRCRNAAERQVEVRLHFWESKRPASEVGL